MLCARVVLPKDCGFCRPASIPWYVYARWCDFGDEVVETVQLILSFVMIVG